MYHARPRFFIAIILVLPLLAAAPGTGESQVLVGGRAGAYLDHGDPFIGGEVLIGVEEDLYLNPNVELVFPERANKATFNFDLHYDFARRGRAFFWVGGGLAVIYVDPDGSPDSRTDAGANILFYPTAIGWQPEEKAVYGERQHQAWEISQRAHAIANGCYVAAVNRTGFEPDPSGRGGIEFWGQSFIAGPDGALVCKAPADEEIVLVSEIDLTQLEASRTGWPFLRDRRIDAYGDITRRFLDE